jgi:hypothetical protein
MKETKVIRSADQVNKAKVCEELAGSFHEYADTVKIDKEKEFYKKGLAEKYGNTAKKNR